MPKALSGAGEVLAEDNPGDFTIVQKGRFGRPAAPKSETATLRQLGCRLAVWSASDSFRQLRFLRDPRRVYRP